MSTDAIAVIGLSVRAPDAGDADEFWRNLLAGRNSIHRLSEEQLLAAGEDPALIKDPHYIAARPLLDDVGGFDHTYFGISPRESELRNPQHRLFLELCSTALQHAGYEPSRYDGEIGVYGGCASDTYVDDHIRADPELLAQVGDMVALVSNNIDYLATYTSYRLGLDGPSLNVRTACSTSLVATHLACQALRLGDCDIALAGGVEIETPYGRGYRHVAGGIDSADGYCRPLDSEASGTVFGSGGGVVVLKRLADALADGDPVHAVIRGSAVNNDGAARPGFTAPSSEGQSRVIAEALAVAGVAPDTVSYVELHGTGTQMGDPVEVHGLHQAMLAVADGELRTGSCAIGSVKSNLGHLGPASGIVGLIKTVLALRHESIPPTINVRTPNPQLRLEETPFKVADTVLPWPRTAGAPRRAGVSSFGFGGTNAHVVLEEAPSPAPQPERPERTELLVW
ncbi:type I polyketide synthase, partial [Streptomyces sp. SID685]|nr:type I polyketide synthase [Streptomyces sp. SID685]